MLSLRPTRELMPKGTVDQLMAQATPEDTAHSTHPADSPTDRLTVDLPTRVQRTALVWDSVAASDLTLELA